MKFRYYMVHLPSGEVHGTNDAKVATGFSTSEEYVVVDAETGKGIEYGASFWIAEV